MQHQQWRISVATIDQFDYTYDYAGNRLTRDIPSSLYAGDNRDQKFAHDNLHRLKTSDEGTLSMGSISSPTFEEDYTLDELGNWTNLVKKTGGTPSLDHGRAHNEANETGTITTTTGTPWEDPACDDAGNVTTIPQPKALANGYTATYDVWNRLIKLNDGTNDVQVNEYERLHRRLVLNETGGSRTECNATLVTMVGVTPNYTFAAAPRARSTMQVAGISAKQECDLGRKRQVRAIPVAATQDASA